jgi:signal transduction histidine kinase
MPSPFLSPEQMERMAWIAWRTQMLQMEHARRQFGRRQHGGRGRDHRRERPRWGNVWDQRTQSEAQAQAEMWRRSMQGSREAWGATNPPAATPWFQPQPQTWSDPQAWNDPQAWKAQAEEWRKKQRTLFRRILITFASFLVLIAGSVGVLTLVFTGLLGGNHDSALLVWIVGIGLALGLPLLGAGIARIAFVNIARPLAQVMAVADAVAGGDLSVRVPVDEARGRADDFAQLSHTINRMLDELQRTLEDRRNLTADVAHDLRTPLHIIQGNLEGILDGVYQPTPEHIGMLLEETHLLSRLIEDLRTLSLAESGYLQLHKQPVNVGELLADVSTGFGAQAEEAGVTLRVETTGFVPSSEDEGKAGAIEADAMRLNQVLANLVGNALRHTPSGGSITLLGEPIEGGVRIIVSDTGSGIAPDDLPYIFDRFWRGDVSRSHGEGAGGGLGLAIVKQLVELHGGQVHVQSALGHGTQFTVDLPTRVVEPEPHVVDLRS